MSQETYNPHSLQFEVFKLFSTTYSGIKSWNRKATWLILKFKILAIPFHTHHRYLMKKISQISPRQVQVLLWKVLKTWEVLVTVVTIWNILNCRSKTYLKIHKLKKWKKTTKVSTITPEKSIIFMFFNELFSLEFNTLLKSQHSLHCQRYQETSKILFI